MFRIYYGDGSTFEGENPEDAPKENIQAIAWPDVWNESRQNWGRAVISQWDFYFYTDTIGTWHGTNEVYDLLQHLMAGTGPGGVRAVGTGRMLSCEAYKAIIERAREDDLCPRKSSNANFRERGLGKIPNMP